MIRLQPILSRVTPWQSDLSRLPGCIASLKRAKPLLETVDGGLVTNFWGLGQRSLGISAACGRQWEAAELHFRTALEQAHELPFRTEQPEVRRWYAWMLLERDEPGDREEAHRLLHEAIPMFEELGMVKHAELARGMLSRAASRRRPWSRRAWGCQRRGLRN